MHSTFAPEGLIFLALPIVLWVVSGRARGWLRFALRFAAILIAAVIAWNTFVWLR